MWDALTATVAYQCHGSPHAAMLRPAACMRIWASTEMICSKIHHLSGNFMDANAPVWAAWADPKG